jgi:hypothetical protein
LALALLGLVVAAAVSLAASSLSSQHIGLSSEPLSAGQQLTPAEDSTPRQPAKRHTKRSHRSHHHAARPPVTTTAPTPVPVQPAPVPVQPAPVPVQPAPPAAKPAPGQQDDSGRDNSMGAHGGDD